MMKKYLFLFMALLPYSLFAQWTDVTYLFLRNPNFAGNNRAGWTCTRSSGSLNVNYECMEVYNSSFDVSQILTGLPKGSYRLSAQAFYRAGSHEVAYWNRQDGSENLTAVIYAGSNEQIVKSVYDCPFSGVADDLWSPDDNSFYPNWMYSASVQFGNGEYVNTLDFNTEGSLQIGIRNENHIDYNWCIFDNFSLSYKGTLDISIYKSALTKAFKVAQDMQAKIPTELFNQLMSVVNNYNKNYNTHEDYYAAIQSIYEAIDTYASDASINGYNDFLTLKSYIQDLYNVTPYREDVAGAHETLRQAISNAEKEASNATTAEELNSITERLKNAGIQYVNNASPLGNAKFDITFMLTNPDLQGVQDWTKADGWYTDEPDGNSQARVGDWTYEDGIHDRYYEYWNESPKDDNKFTVYQIVNLPEGKYDFSCYAFASGSWSEEGVYLYANDFQGADIYENMPTETHMTFRQPNSSSEDVKIGLKVLSGNQYNWMGMGYLHLYKIYDIESDKSVIKASDITLTVPQNTMKVGETMVATATVSPSNATLQEVKWSSSDPFVFCIDKDGNVTAYNCGTAKITATTLDGSNITKEMSITVTETQQEDTSTWTELPSVIMNANFETRGNSEGWTIERDGGNSEVRSGCLEFWNDNRFKTSQIIENLPQGHYRLSVQGYHRYGNSTKDYKQILKGEPSSLAYLFVNNQKKTLVPYCSYYEITKPNDEWISPDNGKHWMPNTMESASEAFAKDAYWNYLEFDVTQDLEDVTIGVALDKYTIENWCIFTNFKLETNVEIDLGKTYTMSVKDVLGNDISNKVNIIWYDGQGNQLGTGISIGGVKKDTDLFYSILLDQTLGIKYQEIIKQKVTSEDKNVVCQLKLNEEVIIHGRVSAYSTALPRVNVSLTQWLNGKYEYEANALTDANGEFSINAYNDSTELIVTANGYIDNKTVRRNLNNGGELGNIDMIEVQGKVIALNLSYQEATREGAEPIVQNWYSDTRNIDYTVQNVTKGKEIEDFAIQQGNIVMPTGTDRGDKIQITVRSLNEKFAEATAEGIIADNDTANVSINLLAFGGIEAIYGQKGDDNLLAMLYDSTGKLQMRTVCSTSRLTFTNLAAGIYTLVTMGYNGAIGSVSDISDLANMDLAEGADYVRSIANVRDGYISSINVASVPELDASKFEYTGLNTSYMPNKTQLVAGNFITLTARLDFKEQYSGKTDNVKVVVEIPEGCEFVPNSVVIGAKPIPHSLNGDKLTITVDKEDLDRRIRFCVIPTQTGTYMTSAYAEFDYKGTKTQPMGQIRFESTSGDYYVPSTTRTPTIMVGGIGVPKADVEVYDGECLIGTTRSLANGKWSLNCELNNAYNLSTHSIYVKYRGEGNVVGKTDAKDCFYDINAVIVQSVTMLNTAHPAGNLTPTQYSSVWDFHALTSSKDYYLYWPAYPDFTFLVNLSENDTTKVSDVVLSVFTMDGDVRRLPATYDGKQGCFVATGSFDSYSAPVNVSVYLKYNRPILSDRKQFEDALLKSESFTQSNSKKEVDTIIDSINDALANGDNNTAEELIGYLYHSLGIELEDIDQLYSDEITLDEITAFIENEYESSMWLNPVDDYTFDDENGSSHRVRSVSYQDFDKNSLTALRCDSIPLTDTTFMLCYSGNGTIIYVDSIKNKCLIVENSDDGIGQNYRPIRKALDLSVLDGYLSSWSQIESLINSTGNELKDLIGWVTRQFNNKLDNALAALYVVRNNKERWKKGIEVGRTYKELLDEEKKLLEETAGFRRNISALGALFKTLDAAAIINDNRKARESIREWQRIIRTIESIDCPDMPALASKAKDYALKSARGYNTNIITNEAAFIGVSKIMKLKIPKLGAGGALAIDLLVNDISFIQGWYTEWTDINWKSEIQLKIPTLKNCKKDDDEDKERDKRKNKDPKTKEDDPSGFVFEAVPTNRIEGVKATIYYAEDGEIDYPIQWNAAEFGQVNPQITEGEGLYAWDVPQGLWKVVFEKEGYETTQTDWLPVPPPQLEVNIPMSQAVAPFVENAIGAESGITLDFSKYMKPNTLTKSSRVTVTCNGEKASGDVKLLNLEENPFNNEEYVSKIKFVPNKSFKTSDEVIITVKKEVESYAGKQMTEDFVLRVKIESEINEIACDSVMAVDYHGTGILEVSVLPAAAAKGRTIQVTSTSSMIASTDAQSVTLNDEGKARIVVSGELPGSTSLHLSMPDAGKEKYVAVSVVTKEEQVVKTPKASKLSGSEFEESYMLSLTCSTKGATIYYTIDGSCPCNEQTRKKYTGPITLPEGQITLQAIAVREGMTDSEISVFNYKVTNSSIETIVKKDEITPDIETSYQDGSITVRGAKGASCYIYDLQGHELAHRSKLGNQTIINVPKTDVYLVSISINSEQTIVRKIFTKQF